ncbi:MAG: hypothetical protein ABSE51_18870 [Terracidiphilus sp.]|jgi:hypothetical protein
MNAALRVAIAGMSAWAAVGMMAQPAAQAAALGDLQVKEVSVAEIDTAHVRLAVDLNLTAAQSVTLENLRLCSLRLNGLPVFAAPLNQELVLKKDVATALPPIYVTILFRDLRTTEPLRRMIEKQSVRVEGEMVADLRLSLLEKMALHTEHPRVELALGQDVPVEVGGTETQRSMALTILGVVDSGIELTSAAARYIPDTRSQWIRDLEISAQTSLFAVKSSYALTKGGTSYPVVSVFLGFRVGPAGVVTTAEAHGPWNYDAEFLEAVQSGATELVKDSQEILLRPIGHGDPLSLSAKDFSVELRGTVRQSNLIAVGGSSHKQIKILLRAAPGSMAVLAFHAPPTSPGLTAATAAVAAQDSWEQVAVFRLREDAVTRQPSVEVLQLRAHREGKGIQLSEPVDAAVFGSPIVTPAGVIGLVQDEQAGAFLPADLLAPATGDAK